MLSKLYLSMKILYIPRWVVAAYFVVVMLLLWLPLSGLGVALNSYVFGLRADHLVHAIVFVPCVVLLRSVCLQWRTVAVWGAALLFALVTECVQYFLPYRSFDVNDLIANTLGVTLGLVALRYVQLMVRTKNDGCN